MMSSEKKAYSKAEFEQLLRSKGALYHIYHPFQVAMNTGNCTPSQIRGWVANRFYYQINIPIKDAAVIANCDDRDARRLWVQRILDHDGSKGEEGGIEAWLRLGEACGMSREEIIDQRHVLPGVRFAVDAYVNFARNATWQEAACSSLTELFAPDIHRRRLDTWPQHYQWINTEGYQYFRQRLSEARRDVEHGLVVTLDYFKSYEQQQQALTILQFKLEILWSMLDAMTMAYIHHTPPFHCCVSAKADSDKVHQQGTDNAG